MGIKITPQLHLYLQTIMEATETNSNRQQRKPMPRPRGSTAAPEPSLVTEDALPGQQPQQQPQQQLHRTQQHHRPPHSPQPPPQQHHQKYQQEEVVEDDDDEYYQEEDDRVVDYSQSQQPDYRKPVPRPRNRVSTTHPNDRPFLGTNFSHLK